MKLSAFALMYTVYASGQTNTYKDGLMHLMLEFLDLAVIIGNDDNFNARNGLVIKCLLLIDGVHLVTS